MNTWKTFVLCSSKLKWKRIEYVSFYLCFCLHSRIIPFINIYFWYCSKPHSSLKWSSGWKATFNDCAILYYTKQSFEFNFTINGNCISNIHNFIHFQSSLHKHKSFGFLRTPGRARSQVFQFLPPAGEKQKKT